jgi:hypothetical protein
MKWVIGIVAFVVALPLTMLAFQYMPDAYFDWLKRQSWGREIGGLVMTAIAVLIAYGLTVYFG